MTIPTVFDTCTPRSDVLRGEIVEADFAADLASVVAGKGSPEYRDPVRFFADTYPTRGLRSLFGNVCRRLAGAGGEVAAIFRLDTSYGGGKTHGLIALTHAARGLGTVPNIGATDTEYEIWQVPSAATPQVKAAVRMAGLRGRNLELVEHRVVRRLAKAGARLSRAVDEKRHGYIVTEDLALTLGLFFRTLAPMRSREKMRTVIEGIEAMEREETAYWLGMAMHRPNPRRVLTALRVPLTPASRRRN